MKIVVIDTTLDGELIGGAQIFLPLLLRGLIERGHEVHLITGGQLNEKVRRQIEESRVILHDKLWSQRNLVEEITPVLADWLNGIEPDIYLISVSPDVGWAVLPLLNPGIATLAIGHTDSETFYLPARHYRIFLTRVIGVSCEVCSNYTLCAGIEDEKVEFIPYGVQSSPVEPVDIGDDILKVIYVGRLEEEQKRVSDLIRIVKLLSEKGVDFKFTVVGDGAEMSKMQNDLKQEINLGTVEFRGWMPSNEVVRLMREAEIFVLTSAYEGFCIALIESMSNGCCPVVTNIKSGNNQLIDNGRNGFIVEIGAVEEFVEKLQFLSKNRLELSRMRKSAWLSGKDYNIVRMVENYESCFRNASADAKSSPREKLTGYPLMETCQSRYPLWLRRFKQKLSI